MYSKKMIRKFIELKAKNIPNEKIASELKVSERTLTNWGRKYLNEILIQKQIELDELKSALNIDDTQHLEFYSKIIEKCKKVFLTSDFEKTECADVFKIFNLAVNQVQKCKFIDVKDVAFSKKPNGIEEHKSLFSSPLFQNSR
jgi:hypothetical protein